MIFNLYEVKIFFTLLGNVWFTLMVENRIILLIDFREAKNIKQNNKTRLIYSIFINLV